MSEKVKIFYNKLPEIIENVIAPMGRFQYAVVFMLCFNSAIIAIENVVTTFYSFQPDFSCENLDTNQCNPNGTCTSGYVFNDQIDHTIVSEWSLICDRKVYVPLVSTFYFFGLAIGAFVCGLFSDRFGRKPTLLLCLYAQGVIGLSLSIVNKFHWFVTLRVVQGFFVQGTQTALFPLLMEYCAPAKRTIGGMIFELMWAGGLTFLGIVAYAERHWRSLQIFLSIPTMLTIFWSWAIPESMNWLYENHREHEAFKVCIQTAKWNGNYDSIEVEHRYWLENIQNAMVTSSEHSNTKNMNGVWSILRDIFQTKCLRKHILIMASTWFAVAMAYYGVLFFMPAIAGDRHLNFILSGIIEFFVYVSMYFVLAKFGRKNPTMIYLHVNGVLIIMIGICNSFEADEIVQTIFALLARGTSASLFYVTYVQANELFPTISRGCAFGICGFMGKCGTLLAPFMLPLAEHVSPSLPMSLLGILSILIGIAQFFVPETMNIQTPNSVEEAKRIWE